MRRWLFCRRINVLLALGVILVGARLAISSAQSKVDPPTARGYSAWELIANGIAVVSDAGGAWIPQTGDSEVDAMVRAEARRVLRVQNREAQRAKMEEVHQRHLAQMEIWRGTKVMALPGAIPGSMHSFYDDIVPLLERSASPALRNEIFADFFEDRSEFKCLGWHAHVRLIEPNDDGWLLTIQVNPQLERKRGGIVSTPLSSVETWTLTSEGELQFVEAKKVGFALVFVD